jgi:hypothetical protein
MSSAVHIIKQQAHVAQATVAVLQAAIERKFGLFTTLVHTNHGMPLEVSCRIQLNNLLLKYKNKRISSHYHRGDLSFF